MSHDVDSLVPMVGASGAIGGVMGAYAHAVEAGDRFYSYGDSSLLFKAA